MAALRAVWIGKRSCLARPFCAEGDCSVPVNSRPPERFAF